MAEDRSSKTEKPTPKRLSDARSKGQVSKSMEINSCVVLLAAVFTIYFASSYMYSHLAGLLTRTFSNVAQTSLEGPDLFVFLLDNLWAVGALLAPLVIMVAIAGLAANLLQIGPLFTVHPLQPSLSKLNPISGLSRLFSARSLMELFKSLVKIAIIGSIAYLTIRKELINLVPLGDASPEQIWQFMLALAFEIFLKTCWALLVLALLDLAFQKWQHVRDLRMSREEIKEEMKQTEGDPLVKARIRSVQRDTARRRMMAAVPKADVVVTNPSHLAVALLYEVKKAEAPVVVAKGRALVAEKIKSTARAHGVPIIEDKPLAQALYKMVEVGQTIPVLFYQAVAEVLAAVYRLKGKSVYGR
ncbi:MAG: flagellar biosynthesis protein FlhB [Pseudomonadota bacterium]